MAEISIRLSDELEQAAEESGLDLPAIATEAIVSKLVQQQLSRSKVLQRAMFETLVSKSKLTKKDAQLLAEKINQGMLQDFAEWN